MRGEFKGHQWRINSIDVTRDGAMIVTTGEEKTARVFDTRSGILISQIKGQTKLNIWGAELLPNPRFLRTSFMNAPAILFGTYRTEN
jgi:hypothetical protein